MMNRTMVMDRYYLDCRCMILELAATLDRYDRAAGASDAGQVADERLVLLRQAIGVLADSKAQSDRSERILRMLSEPEA